MRIIAIIKFPDVDRTTTLELGQQILIYGALYGKLYQSELFINSPDQNSSTPYATLDIGFEYRSVVSSV
jgi:hypothetical protein